MVYADPSSKQRAVGIKLHLLRMSELRKCDAFAFLSSLTVVRSPPVNPLQEQYEAMSL